MIPHKELLWTVPVLRTNLTPPHQPTTNHPDGRFITVLFTATTDMQSYPANFAKVDKRALA